MCLPFVVLQAGVATDALGSAAGDDEKEREDELAAITAAIEAVEAQTRAITAAAAAAEAQLRNVRVLSL